MKQNPYYRLTYIAGVPYLLTYGQGNADYRRDLRLNETGVFLWNNAKNAADAKELVALCATHYGCTPQEYPAMAKDVSHFINALYQQGILLPETNRLPDAIPSKTLQIAGLYLELFGPKEAFLQSLLSFETSDIPKKDAPVQQVRISFAPPAFTQNGALLLRNKSLCVLDHEDSYILLFPEFTHVEEVHLTKSGQYVTCFCRHHLSPCDIAVLQEELSYAMRICFFYFAGKNEMVALHSSSILYRDKIWLFSAPSGYGKSTHTNLWNHFVQAPVINGDLNLISATQSGAVVHGIPWCGTSGFYDTHTHPLGGIVFLEQNKENLLETLSDDQKQLRLLHRILTPSWTEEMHKENARIVETFYDKILIYRLACQKNESAVTLVKSAFDSYLDKC